jgi:hypothetical protein
LAISVAIVLSFSAASNSFAQSCAETWQCGWPLMCHADLFGGHCDTSGCNSDADCRTASACDGGVCSGFVRCEINGDCNRGEFCGRRHLCVPIPATQPPGHGGGSNGGSACGIVDFGNVRKHVGCPHGLICSNPNGHGTCRKPQT